MGCVESREVQIKPEDVPVNQSTTIIVHQAPSFPSNDDQSINQSAPPRALTASHQQHAHEAALHSKPVLIRDPSDSDVGTSEDDEIEDLSVCEQPNGGHRLSDAHRSSDAANAPSSTSRSSQRPQQNNQTIHHSSNRSNQQQQQHQALGHRSSISISPASPSSVNQSTHQHPNVSSSLTPPINEHRGSLTASNLSTKRHMHTHNASSVPHSVVNKRPSLSAHRSPVMVPGSPSRSIVTALTAAQEPERDMVQLALASMPTTPRSVGVESPRSISRFAESSTPSITQMRLHRHGSKYRVVDIDALPESVYYQSINHAPAHLNGTPAVSTSSFASIESFDAGSHRKPSLSAAPSHQSTNHAASPPLTSFLSTLARGASRSRPGHKHAASFDLRALDFHTGLTSPSRPRGLHQRTYSVAHTSHTHNLSANQSPNMQRSVEALAASSLLQSAEVAAFPAPAEDDAMQGPTSPIVPTVPMPVQHCLGSRKSSRRFTKSRHSNHLFSDGELTVRVHASDQNKTLEDEAMSPTRSYSAATGDEPQSAKSLQGQEHGNLMTHSRKRSVSSVRAHPNLKHFESSNGDGTTNQSINGLQTGRISRSALLLFSTPMATQLAGIAVHKLGLTSDIALNATDALNKLRERSPTICLIDLAVKNSKQVLQAISNISSDTNSPASPSSASNSLNGGFTITTIAIVPSLDDTTIQEITHLGCSGCIEQGASLSIVLYDYLALCKSRSTFIIVNARLEFSSVSLNDRQYHPVAHIR